MNSLENRLVCPLWMLIDSLSIQGYLDHGHMIWVAKDVISTYGQSLCDMVLHHPNITVFDTRYCSSRPSLLEMAIKVYDRDKYDCVFVTSNPVGTAEVVRGCRAVGIHAYGPIFDSWRYEGLLIMWCGYSLDDKYKPGTWPLSNAENAGDDHTMVLMKPKKFIF